MRLLPPSPWSFSLAIFPGFPLVEDIRSLFPRSALGCFRCMLLCLEALSPPPDSLRLSVISSLAISTSSERPASTPLYPISREPAAGPLRFFCSGFFFHLWSRDGFLLFLGLTPPHLGSVCFVKSFFSGSSPFFLVTLPLFPSREAFLPSPLFFLYPPALPFLKLFYVSPQ